MRNVFHGSKNGLINRFCCLFSYHTLANIIVNIFLLISGLCIIHKFTLANRFLVKSASLADYNESIVQVLTFASIVSITVFLVDEIKETNSKNKYTEHFFKIIFKSKFKLDFNLKNAFFVSVPVLVIVAFILLKFGESFSDYKSMNILCGVVYSICVIALFLIIEIIIYYSKINHKKIEISRSLHGVIHSKFTVNFIESPHQANEVIDIIKLSDNITTLKNSVYILLDIFSEYSYFNKIEIYESIAERICDNVIEFCTDKKYGNADSEIAFIINSIISDIINDVTEKDSKNNRILLAFFLFSKYFCRMEFENMNSLSKNSQEEFFNLFPYIFLIYSDELKNKIILMEKYQTLFIENKLELVDEEKRKKLYGLIEGVIIHKFAVSGLKLDSYYIFKKFENKKLFSLYVYDYIIFNNQV